MTHDRIKQLAQLLPADAGIFNAGRQPGAAPPRFAERMAIALNAPNFGHRFVLDYVTRGEPLPPAAHESWLRRAYSHFANANVVPDNVMEQVEQITVESNQFLRSVLNALLICHDSTHAKIAEHLDLDEQAVRFYEQLYFSARDLSAEKIARLVFPEGRFQSLRPDGMDELPIAQRLLIAGHQHGAKEVLWLAGLDKRQDSPSTEDSLKAFETALLNNAVQLARSGGLNSKTAPGIGHAKSLLVARGRDSAKSPAQKSQTSSISLKDSILLSMPKNQEEADRESEAGRAMHMEVKAWLKEQGL